MRAIALCTWFGTVVVLGGGGNARAEPDELRRSFSLGSAPQIELSNLSGPVRVEGHAQSTVELHAWKEGGSVEDRRRVTIEIKTSGNSLRVRTRCPDAEQHGWGHGEVCGRVSVRYALRMPHGAGLDCKAVSSPVTVSNLQGPIGITTVSGPIDLTGTSATPRRLHSVSGSIRAAAGGGELRASTVSGPVLFRLAPRARADLKLSTVSGRLHSALPVAVEQQDRRTLRGKLGGGGPPLQASTVSGSIDVRSL